MSCFESYMEFREEVDKVKKERRQKVVPQPPDDNRSGLFSNTAPVGAGWMNRQKIKGIARKTSADGPAQVIATR